MAKKTQSQAAADNLAKARAARQQSINQQVQKLLQADNVNPELKRKLAYAHGRASEEPSMVSVRKDLIREATRRRA